MLLFVAGCGGQSNRLRSPAQISGVVFDINGDIVRDARVYIPGGPETRSNSSGAYLLDKVTLEEGVIRAEVTQDNIGYFGTQYFLNFDGERTKSVNITVVRNSQRATVRGTVRTDDGFAIEGARVFANAGTQSSTYAVTDANGEYVIDTLQGGIDYDLIASVRGLASDTDFVNVAAGNEATRNFFLGQAGDPLLSPPSNFDAVAWTSPRVNQFSTQNNAREAYEQVKRLFDPERAKRPVAVQRLQTASGNPVEVDLSWDAVFDNRVLGYGIYRRQGTIGSLTAIDFLRDPMAGFFADQDERLFVGSTYGYAVSRLNTRFPDGPNGESDLTPVASVEILDDMIVTGVSTGPLRFNWQVGSGATSYVVFVFDRYPRLGVDSFWNNAGAPTNGSSLVYSGPALQSGQTYYYLVLGLANNNTSRTISPVLSFVAP